MISADGEKRLKTTQDAEYWPYYFRFHRLNHSSSYRKRLQSRFIWDKSFGRRNSPNCRVNSHEVDGKVVESKVTWRWLNHVRSSNGLMLFMRRNATLWGARPIIGRCHRVWRTTMHLGKTDYLLLGFLK